MDLRFLDLWSATVITQGVVGNLQWQVSNDLGRTQYPPPTGIVNWSSDPSLQTPMSSSGTDQCVDFWNVQDAGYSYLRMAWVHTSGTGTIDAFFTGKGRG